MQSTRIPKYKSAKGNQSARTDSGIVHNKRRSVRRVKKQAAGNTVSDSELKGNPNTSSEVVTPAPAVTTIAPSATVTVPATQVEKPRANRPLQGPAATSTISSPAPSKSYKYEAT
jgi:hypothetical protein